ncbi:MAG TPA: AtpZ/AtpI family protein [Bdellovibrionota bacterium]|nr:AtpZ/AtpI family protein [Bdellovibrionota bacterium]
MISGLAIQLVLCVVLGLFIGNWLDKKCGTTPFMIIGFAFLGSVCGFMNLIKGLKKIKNDK